MSAVRGGEMNSLETLNLDFGKLNYLELRRYLLNPV